jgi:hypothetical protein
VFDVLKIEHHQHSGIRLFKNLLEIALLNMATIKTLQFFRFKDNYAFLVQMIVQVLIDLKPFLFVFFFFSAMFSMVYIVMETSFDGADYPGLSKF